MKLTNVGQGGSICFNVQEKDAISIALQSQIDSLTEYRSLEKADGIENPEIDGLISASLSALTAVGGSQN